MIATSLLATPLFLSIAARAAERPDSPSFGIGIGVRAPVSPLALNAVDARLRLLDALTIEPLLYFDTNDDSSHSSRQDGSTTVDESSETNITSLALDFHYALARRDSMDFKGILGFGYSSGRYTYSYERVHNENTSSDDSEETSSFLSLDWGLGLEWFLGRHISWSADAINTMYQKESNSYSDQEDGSESDDSSKDLLVGWDPSIRVMVHLYF